MENGVSELTAGTCGPPRRGRFLCILLSSLVLLPSPAVTQSDTGRTGHAEITPFDSTSTPFSDPARNRLFWMSTGRVMPGGQFSFGVFELFIFQGGYGLTDYFQLNVTGTVGYASVGTKLQVLPPSGAFGGLAFGLDAGFYPGSDRLALVKDGLWAASASASFGDDDIMGHLSGMGIFQGKRTDNPRIFLQAGCSVTLLRTSTDRTQLMGELWLRRQEYSSRSDEFYVMVVPLGIRHATPRSVFEIAIMFGPSFGTGGGSSVPFIPLPYLGFQWFM